MSNPPRFRTFIQWKGTELCIDFDCVCGAHNHYDGEFAYYIECWHCHRRFEMPSDISSLLVETPPDSEQMVLRDIEYDESESTPETAA